MEDYKLTAIVVDDEENARNLMLKVLKDYAPEVKVVGSASNTKEGLKFAEDLKPDVLFLDLEMPGGTGINLVEGLSYSPFVIFVTAYEHYAIRAIKAGAFDYLLKPIDIDDLMKAIEKIMVKRKGVPKAIKADMKSKGIEKRATLAFPVKEGVLYIKQDDIVKLEADGSYSTVYLISGEKHVLSKNLKDISEQLCSCFYRCHASYVINLNAVTKLLKNEGIFVQLSDGSKIPVSRKNKDEFNAKMVEFRSGGIL